MALPLQDGVAPAAPAGEVRLLAEGVQADDPAPQRDNAGNGDDDVAAAPAGDNFADDWDAALEVADGAEGAAAPDGQLQELQQISFVVRRRSCLLHLLWTTGLYISLARKPGQKWGMGMGNRQQGQSFIRQISETERNVTSL